MIKIVYSLEYLQLDYFFLKKKKFALSFTNTVASHVKRYLKKTLIPVKRLATLHRSVFILNILAINNVNIIVQI